MCSYRALADECDGEHVRRTPSRIRRSQLLPEMLASQSFSSRRTHLVNRDAARPRPSCELRRYGGQQTPMRVERVTSEQTRRTQSTQCADLWFLPSSSSHSAPGASICIHRRRNGVDAVEPAPAKYCKDRSYLVRIESTASSTTTGRSKSWY